MNVDGKREEMVKNVCSSWETSFFFHAVLVRSLEVCFSTNPDRDQYSMQEISWTHFHLWYLLVWRFVFLFAISTILFYFEIVRKYQLKVIVILKFLSSCIQTFTDIAEQNIWILILFVVHDEREEKKEVNGNSHWDTIKRFTLYKISVWNAEIQHLMYKVRD